MPSLQDPGLVPTCRRLSIDMLLPLRVPYRAWAGKHGISSGLELHVKGSQGPRRFASSYSIADFER